MLSIKVTREPPNGKIMVDDKIASGKDTSMLDIILSLIGSPSKNNPWNSVPLLT